VHGTHANAGTVLFTIAGIGFRPGAFLFASVWFFNRPNFLLPPHLRDRRGALLTGVLITGMSGLDDNGRLLRSLSFT
jgi:hypothetical protein